MHARVCASVCVCVCVNACTCVSPRACVHVCIGQTFTGCIQPCSHLNGSFLVRSLLFNINGHPSSVYSSRLLNAPFARDATARPYTPTSTSAFSHLFILSQLPPFMPVGGSSFITQGGGGIKTEETTGTALPVISTHCSRGDEAMIGTQGATPESLAAWITCIVYYGIHYTELT